MLACPITHIAPLLPHSGRMILIDEIIDYDEQSLSARSCIRPNCILLPEDQQALPSYLAIEIMAQAVAAWAGIQAHNQGQNINLGFLLGSRKLSIYCAEIALATPLIINIHLSLQDQTGMGIFDASLCYEQAADKPIMQGKLNVFSPKTPII